MQLYRYSVRRLEVGGLEIAVRDGDLACGMCMWHADAYADAYRKQGMDV